MSVKLVQRYCEFLFLQLLVVNLEVPYVVNKHLQVFILAVNLTLFVLTPREPTVRKNC